MPPRKYHLFGCTRPKPRHGNIPAGLALASGFDLCFHCKVGSGLVLRRPIETAAFISHLVYIRVLRETPSGQSLRNDSATSDSQESLLTMLNPDLRIVQV